MRDRAPEPWLDRADEDVVAARILAAAAESLAGLAAYHVQQSAEQLLKGVLVGYGIRPPRSHDLEDLIGRLPPSTPSLIDLDRLRALTIWFGAFRYPGEEMEIEPPTGDELRSWCDEIARLIGAIRSELDGEGRLP
jgi:HEPN domain-containing protein